MVAGHVAIREFVFGHVPRHVCNALEDHFPQQTGGLFTTSMLV